MTVKMELGRDIEVAVEETTLKKADMTSNPGTPATGSTERGGGEKIFSKMKKEVFRRNKSQR